MKKSVHGFFNYDLAGVNPSNPRKLLDFLVSQFGNPSVDCAIRLFFNSLIDYRWFSGFVKSYRRAFKAGQSGRSLGQLCCPVCSGPRKRPAKAWCRRGDSACARRTSCPSRSGSGLSRFRLHPEASSSLRSGSIPRPPVSSFRPHAFTSGHIPVSSSSLIARRSGVATTSPLESRSSPDSKK